MLGFADVLGWDRYCLGFHNSDGEDGVKGFNLVGSLRELSGQM